MNLPNKLTILRLILIPFFVLFFYLNFPGHYIVAAVIFIAAAVTDFLDGHIARKRGLVTNLGKFLDPIADKALVSTAFILMLTRANDVFTAFLGANSDWVVTVAGIVIAIIIARETIVSGLRMVAASANIVIAADKLGKYKTVFQDISIGVLLVAAQFAPLAGETGVLAVLGMIVSYIGLSVFAVAGILTVISGINYLVKNKEVFRS